MNDLQFELAKNFHSMHAGEGCFLMPNAWDIGSAQILLAAGFQSIGTTSAGVAFSLGRPDNVFCSDEAR
jgi:2-methylisocitrate lyase-like PEP mutase family enzyme